jgi:hypothetical protein
LRGLLADDSSGALVIGAGAGPGDSLVELLWMWRRARDECNAAYETWCRSRRKIDYAIYRAAADRADTAQDALAASARRYKGRRERIGRSGAERDRART